MSDSAIPRADSEQTRACVGAGPRKTDSQTAGGLFASYSHAGSFTGIQSLAPSSVMEVNPTPQHVQL